MATTLLVATRRFFSVFTSQNETYFSVAEVIFAQKALRLPLIVATKVENLPPVEFSLVTLFILHNILPEITGKSKVFLTFFTPAANA
jgi:hypothetical protein